MYSIDIADAKITLEHDGETVEGRQQYTYVIRTPQWEYVGNDISSGVGAEPDETAMAPTLLSFLSACAESRAHGGGENAGLFPEHVGQWAEENSDELDVAHAELSGDYA